MESEREDADRFARQVRFGPLGLQGQRRLCEARVAIVGCGALGGASATALLRAGVRHLRLIDRDLAEWSNLPRQLLLDEADVEAAVPKAVAAAEHLRRIDATASLEPLVHDLTAGTCRQLLGACDVVIDGTDNFEARFLINDFCCRERIPWIYGGAIGSEGRVLAILPGETACLRCLVPEPPAPGELPTCQTAGILGPAAMVVGAVQAAEAIKLLAVDIHERAALVAGRMLVFDLWQSQWRTVDLTALAADGCPTCRDGDFPWLEGRRGAATAVLCGREAVQVAAAVDARPDLDLLAESLRACGQVTQTPWMLKVEVEPGITLSVFADGRAIVFGTRDVSRARSVVARYVGQ